MHSTKSTIRAYVEQVFGDVTLSIGRKRNGKIGLKRMEALQRLKYMTYSLLQRIERKSNLYEAAQGLAEKSQTKKELNTHSLNDYERAATMMLFGNIKSSKNSGISKAYPKRI